MVYGSSVSSGLQSLFIPALSVSDKKNYFSILKKLTNALLATN